MGFPRLLLKLADILVECLIHLNTYVTQQELCFRMSMVRFQANTRTTLPSRLRCLHQQFCPFLAFAQAGLSVTDAMGFKGNSSQGAGGRFMTWNAPLTKEKCVFLTVGVCVLSGERSHYILCQLSFWQTLRAQSPRCQWQCGIKGFSSCCAPCCATLLQ